MAAASAASRKARSAAGVRYASTAVTTLAITPKPEMMRFEYSITAWAEPAGIRLPGSQFGQSVHPRPDAVRRTRPPVTTTSHSSPRVIQALRSSADADTAPDRRRPIALSTEAIEASVY